MQELIYQMRLKVQLFYGQRILFNQRKKSEIYF